MDARDPWKNSSGNGRHDYSSAFLRRSLRASLTRDDAWQTRTVVDEMQKQSLARTDRFRAVGGRPRSSFEYAEVNPYAIATKVGPIGLARALSVLIESEPKL